jgi:hypothetical protein
MQFINTILLAAAALAPLATAQNTIQFVNQDSATTKNIVFTPNAGLEAIPTLVLGPAKTQSQEFPEAWIGNFYSYDDGAANVPGMLGEVAFGAWSATTFYDVSSIVNAGDTKGIKVLYPLTDSSSTTGTVSDLVAAAASASGVSGCNTSGGDCANQYNAPNDIATQATQGSSLVCLVGNPTSSVRRSARFARDYVLGKKA